MYEVMIYLTRGITMRAEEPFETTEAADAWIAEAKKVLPIETAYEVVS